MSTQLVQSFTPDNQLDLMFPSEYIPEDVKTQLHPSLHVRSRFFPLVLYLTSLSLAARFDPWLQQTTAEAISISSLS